MLSTDSGFKGNTILVFWQNLRTETRLRGTKALIPWPSSEHHRTKNILFQTCLECQTLKKDMKIASAVKLSCVGIKKQGKTSLNASISELLYPKKKKYLITSNKMWQLFRNLIIKRNLSLLMTKFFSVNYLNYRLKNIGFREMTDSCFSLLYSSLDLRRIYIALQILKAIKPFQRLVHQWPVFMYCLINSWNDK